MPFDFKEYEQRCSQWSRTELQAELERHNDAITSAGAGTGIAVLAIPLTMGISAVALGGTAPVYINAKKKRTIVKKYLALSEPYVRSNLPIRSAVSRSRSSKSQEEELPDYSASRTSPITQENQVYVPVEEDDDDGDTPPPYSEATLRETPQFDAPAQNESSEQRPTIDTTVSRNNSISNGNEHSSEVHELPTPANNAEHESPGSMIYSPSIYSPTSPRTPLELEDTSANRSRGQGLRTEVLKATATVPAVVVWQSDKLYELR